MSTLTLVIVDKSVKPKDDGSSPLVPYNLSLYPECMILTSDLAVWLD